MTSSYISGLKCMKCGHEQTDMEARLRCAKCNGYTQAVYDLKVARGSLSRKVVSERQGGLWRFREMLPVRSSENIVSIAEGGAPLIRSRKIGKKLGIANLYFKDLTRNPTGSFKDYSSSTSVSKARELDVAGIVLVSAGNASSSFAAYCTMADIEFHAVTIPGSYPAMLVQNAIYCAINHAAQGTSVDAGRLGSMLAEEHGFMDGGMPANPYRVEGKKIIGYEIAENLGWKAPARIVCPTAGGTSILALHKAFTEMQALGWAEGMPALDCIQAESCQPVVQSWRSGEPIVGAKHPDSIAIGLLSANPEAGPQLVDVMRETGGLGMTVSDDEILDAQASLAREEGLFVEPSSAASLAGLIKLHRDGRIPDDGPVVLMLTGSGLKAAAAIAPRLGL